MHYRLLDVPLEIETERLHLRPYKSGDGDWLHTIFRENNDHLAEAIKELKQVLGLDLTSPTEAEIFVRQMVADSAARKRFIFGIWEKATNQYVGDVWIESQDWDLPMHEIGYFIVKDHLSKGFATEATKAGLGFVFNHLKTNKAVLTCDEDNIPSYRVAERCGFIREGCLREQVKRSDGTVVGKLCYGMLKTEFEALNPIFPR